MPPKFSGKIILVFYLMKYKYPFFLEFFVSFLNMDKISKNIIISFKKERNNKLVILIFEFPHFQDKKQNN